MKKETYKDGWHVGFYLGMDQTILSVLELLRKNRTSKKTIEEIKAWTKTDSYKAFKDNYKRLQNRPVES